MADTISTRRRRAWVAVLLAAVVASSGLGLALAPQAQAQEVGAAVPILDPDGDNVLNPPFGTDNCPAVANPDQQDRDDDGLGNACDGPPPVAVDDAYRYPLGGELVVDVPGVLANDTPEGGGVVTFDGDTTEGGTVELFSNGSFVYTPAEDFDGEDTFEYTVENDEGDDTATVTLIPCDATTFSDVDETNQFCNDIT